MRADPIAVTPDQTSLMLEVVATVTGLKEPRQAIVLTKDSQTAFVLNEGVSEYLLRSA